MRFGATNSFTVANITTATAKTEIRSFLKGLGLTVDAEAGVIGKGTENEPWVVTFSKGSTDLDFDDRLSLHIGYEDDIGGGTDYYVPNSTASRHGNKLVLLPRDKTLPTITELTDFGSTYELDEYVGIDTIFITDKFDLALNDVRDSKPESTGVAHPGKAVFVTDDDTSQTIVVNPTGLGAPSTALEYTLYVDEFDVINLKGYDPAKVSGLDNRPGNKQVFALFTDSEQTSDNKLLVLNIYNHPPITSDDLAYTAHKLATGNLNGEELSDEEKLRKGLDAFADWAEASWGRGVGGDQPALRRHRTGGLVGATGEVIIGRIDEGIHSRNPRRLRKR